jgi:1-phosphofructokinase family hexose kinase
MILTVTPNPCVDKTVFLDELKVGAFMRAGRYGCVPGGKGSNVSRAVHALGRPTRALVLVGGHTGAHVVDMIRNDDGVEPVPVWVQASTRTITTILEEPIHRQTAFFEPGPSVTAEEAASLLTAFSNVLPSATVVTLNGTVPDPILVDIYPQMVEMAKAAGVLTILDSHGPEFARGVEAAPYMVKPNRAETEELVGGRLDSDEACWRATEHFLERGVTLVVLSLGARGAFVATRAERLEVVPPTITEVNPVGSGDALVAGFAVGLHEGLTLEETARLGVAAGTANAMSWDIGHFSKSEVEALLPKVRVTRV